MPEAGFSSTSTVSPWRGAGSGLTPLPSVWAAAGGCSVGLYPPVSGRCRLCPFWAGKGDLVAGRFYLRSCDWPGIQWGLGRCKSCTAQPSAVWPPGLARGRGATLSRPIVATGGWPSPHCAAVPLLGGLVGGAAYGSRARGLPRGSVPWGAVTRASSPCGIGRGGQAMRQSLGWGGGIALAP